MRCRCTASRRHDPAANLLHLLQHAAEAFDKDWGFSKETLYGLMAQAAERAHDGLDPARHRA